MWSLFGMRMRGSARKWEGSSRQRRGCVLSLFELFDLLYCKSKDEGCTLWSVVQQVELGGKPSSCRRVRVEPKGRVVEKRDDGGELFGQQSHSIYEKFVAGDEDKWGNACRCKQSKTLACCVLTRDPCRLIPPHANWLVLLYSRYFSTISSACQSEQCQEFIQYPRHEWFICIRPDCMFSL